MAEDQEAMPQTFAEAICMNCGATIYIGYIGKVMKFYQREYHNRPVDQYNMNEIYGGCWSCGFELDEEEVIEKSMLGEVGDE